MVELVKSESTAPFNRTVSDRKILGKRAISFGGKVIGRVCSVNLDSQTHEFCGILINRGIFRTKLYIDRNYIQKITNYAIMLNINPVVLLRGLFVFDHSGKRIGRVVGVNRAKFTNALLSVEIKRGIFGKTIVVPKDSLDSINRGVLLKEGFMENGNRQKT